MNRATFERRRRTGSATSAALVTALLVLVSAPSLAQTPRDKYNRPMGDRAAEESLFKLFADPTIVLDVNQYQCGLRNQGDTCSDVFNSPTGGGGFWPTGSANQYMFNSGINLAGVIPPDAGFAWAGDTTGAYFFDARGTQQHGQGITNIYNSQNPDDLANWPDFGSIPNFPDVSAYVLDEDLFNEVLIGRPAASQQDSWLLYWEGNPALSARRDHPMGITVEQRTLAWNFPQGNEATIFIIYRFTNVTNNSFFQRINEAQYFGGDPNGLPDEGWAIDSIYVSFDVDPDVTADFDKNYSTAILPFNMGVAYEGEFQAPDFTYFPDLFFPPFFTNAPGLVGVKYLRSPIDPVTGEQVGLTLFTVHENPSSPGVQFPDPNGIPQLWRYLSGNIRPALGDAPCTFSNPKERRLCFLAQTPKDTRFLQASGPFSLGPGETQTVVVAQFAAATVETPLIQLGNTAANNPGVPSLRPGCGGAGDEIRPIEVGAGWVSTPGDACSAPGVIDQFDVNVVPGSLLGRALVAQTIFDNKFLLGFAPERPNYFLVPGSNQVTVVWEPSPTEESGDPFFVAAGDPGNALFNANYRQFDVEGYRIYRGTDPSSMRLIAQFDKSGSTFIDHSCETDPTFVVGEPCPMAGDDGIPGTADDDPAVVDIVSPFVQYPTGGVVRLADGTPFVVEADTALAGRGQPLGNTGIPFAFVDRNVRNGFQYFYQVTTFDINSLTSGPTSLESSGETKDVFPQAPASDLTTAEFSVGLFGRGDEPLSVDPPALDRATGTFSGPQAPTELLDGNFLPFAPNLLSTGSFEVRIDSVVPVYYAGEYYLTVTGQQGTVVRGSPENFGLGGVCISAGAGQRCEFDLPPISVPSDPQARQDLLDAGIEAPPASGQLTLSLAVETPQWHSADSDWAYTVPGFWEFDPPSVEGEEALDGGSRWFSGDNESMADPTLGLAHGQLDGVDVIWEPVPFQGVLADYTALNGTTYGGDIMRRFLQTTWLARRGADIKVYWGGAGVDSVIDVTHDLPVPFSTHVRASYGFLTDADGDGVLTHGDFWYIPGLEETSTIGGLSVSFPNELASQPTLMPVDVTGDLASDGDGFGLYLAGEPFLFLASSVPSGTVWTYRSYNGIVSRDASGSYTYDERPRTPGIPGLRFALEVSARAEIRPETADLTQVHTVPDPYYAVSQFDLGPASKNLRFVNLPARATIRIYTLGGFLVDVINHDDPAGGGQTTWDLRNRSNQFVASGVYFFHVTTPTGDQHVGKFTIVNFAN